MTLRLLITARDVAAALHLVEVAKAAQRRGISTHIAAQFPAARYMADAGLPVDVIDLPPAKSLESAEARALLQEATALLRRVAPDAVLCGLSTPFDGGLDEAVLHEFSGPRLVLQDFWGEANLVFDSKADLYLALDEEGVRLSVERHAISAAVVGSPRHAAYGHMNIAATRRQERGRLGVDPHTTVVGYFGQALHGLRGYGRTLEAWIEAVSSNGEGYRALYRPHPRESRSEVERTLDSLARSGLDCILTAEETVESSILTCDVVCSAFSNCTYDAAYLNYFSELPIVTPLALFFDSEIVAYFKRTVRLAEFPYLKAGIVKPVYRKKDLATAIAAAATAEEKAMYWKNARRLANPVHAPNRVLDQVISALNRVRVAGATR